ncbi:MAG: S1C family serine protease [Acidimicrobiales bacterium]
MDGKDLGASGRDPDDEWGDDVDGEALRGWIPPDDRLWRHPSESASSGTLPSPQGLPRTEGRDRTGPWLVGGATACVIVALVAAGLMVTTTNGPEQEATTVPDVASLTSAPTTEAGVARMAPASVLASMLASVRQSTVALTITSSRGTSFATGLVVEYGNIVVTTAKGLEGARSITVTEAGGFSQPAQWVDTDPSSSLSVLHISDDLPVATFDDADPPTGSTAVAMAVSPARRGSTAPLPVVYAGTVQSAGQTLGLDPLTSDFAVTAIAAPLSPDDVGCPLIDKDGQVVGMLEEVAPSGTSSLSIFLPSELVNGVAEELVTLGQVDKGSIGATVDPGDSGTGSPAGAEVDSVDPTGPAAADGMQAGDVITSVDHAPIRSAAELENWLYADPPGSTLTVTFVRAGESLTRSVQVVDPDADAPGSVSSP